ncbi:MAG: DUF4115 domain-containing protein [Candidatus Goldbacteria bacterium]|nr:DUF4115 domain-containing protein [Candidatus Goldiibacteriota bacterium]
MKNGFGDLLKEAREKKGFKYSDIHKILKIDEKYIRALEEEDFTAFDRPIYMKLFLNTYARFLKLDVEKINELFLNSPQVKEIMKEEKSNIKNLEKKEIMKETEAKELKQPLPFIINLNNKTTYFVIAGIAIFLIATFWFIFNILKEQQNKAKIEEGKKIYVVQTPQTLKITIKAKADVWMKAKYDGKEEDFLLKNGQEKKILDVAKVVFLVGNAGGVEFIVNGDSIGTIGEEGEVINGLVFEVGKNWYIDRSQGFKRESRPLLYGEEATPTPGLKEQPITNKATEGNNE